MPNYDSILYTKQTDALADYSQAPNLKEEGGTLHLLHAVVTLPASVAANDLLRLGYLPPSAKVIPALCRVQASAAPTAAVVLDVGTAAVGDAFADGISISTRAGVSFDSVTTGVVVQAVTPVKLTAPTPVIAKVTGAAAVGSNVTLTFFIAYTLG